MEMQQRQLITFVTMVLIGHVERTKNGNLTVWFSETEVPILSVIGLFLVTKWHGLWISP